ncbi:MAG: lipopolysaccharide biosynthesis protein [Deltaproteobacteria bacterium]|nr:lipopolysaccharide biosynthesis protein [Deltaproteobacteria bacterium]
MKTSIVRRVGRLLNMDFDYVAKGGAWLSIDQAINMATSLATTLALTNWMAKSDYGAYSYVLSTALLVLPLTLPGISNAMVRSIARGHEGVWRDALRRRLAGGFAASLTLAGAAIWFHIDGRADVAAATMAACVLYPFAFAADDYKTYLHGRREFARYARYNSAVNVATACAILVAGAARWPLPAIIAANLGVRGVGNLIAYAMLARTLVNREGDPEFSRFGWNLSLVAAVNSVSHYIDRFLVGTFYPLETMASYALAANITEPIHVLSVFMNRLAWPKAVRMDAREAAAKFSGKFPILLAVIALMFVGLALVFPMVISLLFPKYVDSISLVIWMVASALAGLVVTYLETYYISQDHLQRVFYWASTIRPIAVILLMGPFMLMCGAMGAVYARLAVRVVASAVLFARLIRERRRLDGGATP